MITKKITTKKCRYSRLDGDHDCMNGADEANCTQTTSEPNTRIENIMPTCHDWMYQCENDKCVPYWW